MKNALIIGGAGQLGRVVVKTFRHSKPTWNVFSVDRGVNNDATENFTIQNNNWKTEKGFIKSIQTKFNNSTYDAIINVAGGWEMESLTSENILPSTENMLNVSFFTALLSGNLAANFLNERSLLVFIGANGVKEAHNPMMLSYHVSKQAVHNLATLIHETQQLKKGSRVITFLPTTLDTESNRKAMPDADFSKWTKLEILADEMKKMADNKVYPQDVFIKL